MVNREWRGIIKEINPPETTFNFYRIVVSGSKGGEQFRCRKEIADELKLSDYKLGDDVVITRDHRQLLKIRKATSVPPVQDAEAMQSQGKNLHMEQQVPDAQPVASGAGRRTKEIPARLWIDEDTRNKTILLQSCMARATETVNAAYTHITDNGLLDNRIADIKRQTDELYAYARKKLGDEEAREK